MGEQAARIGMIWAEAAGGAIGRGGDMPWHLPEDLAHFKRTTLGAPVIMGRRTWESLPERVRPLPGRDNIVVTRDPSYRAAGARVVGSLAEALALLDPAAQNPGDPTAVTAWVMGGGELYRTALHAAAELVITRIDLDVADADTFAPELGAAFTLADPGTPLTSSTGLGYRVERWIRA